MEDGGEAEVRRFLSITADVFLLTLCTCIIAAEALDAHPHYNRVIFFTLVIISIFGIGFGRRKL